METPRPHDNRGDAPDRADEAVDQRQDETAVQETALQETAVQETAVQNDHDAEARAAFDKRRRARSIALAVALAALVILFYMVTIAKMGPEILNRPL